MSLAFQFEYCYNLYLFIWLRFQNIEQQGVAPFGDDMVSLHVLLLKGDTSILLLSVRLAIHQKKITVNNSLKLFNNFTYDFTSNSTPLYLIRHRAPLSFPFAFDFDKYNKSRH